MNQGTRIPYSITTNGELTPVLYYVQVYLRSLPNRLSDQQYHFVVEVVRRQVLWEFFALRDVVSC